MKEPPLHRPTPKSKQSLKRKRQSTSSVSTPSQTPSSTTRAIEGIVYSDRVITWKEQKTLGDAFVASGPGTWPVRCILEERGKGKNRQYLLDWVPHPHTKERFVPTWTPATDVSDDLVNNWTAARKSFSSSENTSQSHGASISQSRNTQTPRTTVKLSFVEKGTTASSSIEIAETQQDTSQHTLPPVQKSISVSIPAADINKSDYESLRSSQIAAELGIGPKSLATQSTGVTDLSSQVESIVSPPKRRAPVLPNSSSDAEPSQSISDGVDSSLHEIPEVNNRQSPYLIRRSSPNNKSATNHAPSAPRAIFEHEDSESSSRSGEFATPEYVPSTEAAPQSRADFDSDPILNEPDSIPPVINPAHQVQSNPGLQTTEPAATILSGASLFVASQTSSPARRQGLNVQSEHPHHDVESAVEISGISPVIDQDLARAVTSPSSLIKKDKSDSSSQWAFQIQLVRSIEHSVSPDRSTDSISTSSPPSRLIPFDSSPQRVTLSRLDPLPKSTLTPVRQRRSVHQRLREAGKSYINKMYSSSSQVPNSVDSANPSAVSNNETGLLASQNSPFQATNASPTIRTINPAAMLRNGYSSSIEDGTMGDNALPIQDSIEDEPLNDEEASTNSKTSSSQQSVENEQDVDHVDGLILPTVPIVGPAQYCLALPAEGKVQSTYFDIMKAKRKAILKFINRHEAIGSSNGSPNRTHQRNDMIELVQRLHDTTTHIDLGLPGFSTQYSLNSQEHAAYANYAGSKFSFLGHLVDVLKTVECSLVVMAQPGPIQQLLEQYLIMKHVSIRRHDPMSPAGSQESDRQTSDFEIELVSTMTSYEVSLRRKPLLIIAFDASFDAQDPQVKRIRTVYSNKTSQLIPVLHLLVANSSEHVDLCIPKSMPSPLRLKLLLRATWQARPNLGGKVTYIPNASDGPDGRPADMADFQRAVRKSPERKLVMLASLIARAAISSNFDTHWPFTSMPKLELSETEEIPVTSSGFTSIAETPKEPLLPQSEPPLSRADTPSGKKRMLDVEGPLSLHKRQRLTPTPLRETTEGSKAQSSQPEHLRDTVARLQAELIAEKAARLKAEEERDAAKVLVAQWKQDHAALQRRYEKRIKKSHELEANNQKLLQTIENNKSRQLKVSEDNASLKEKVKGLQEELTTLRTEIKAGGGDAATLELSREEARTLLAKNIHLEKSLENTRKDFEFTRQQYQNASNKAVDLSNQVRDLEQQAATLSQQASTEKRRLKEINHQQSIQRHTAKVQALELENKAREAVLKKLEEENRQLKRSRGVQTRGSSVQPPGSPSMDVPGRGPRSRQGSPAPGLLPQHHGNAASRGSLLRHER